MTASGGGRKAAGGGTGARAQEARRKAARLLTIAAALGAVWFALEGGEYGTSDLVRQRRAATQLRAEIDSIATIVDSLKRYHTRLRTDPVLQERIAREEFGMVKGPHELLYRFAEPAAPADTMLPASP